jgi:hypothetical protein
MDQAQTQLIRKMPNRASPLMQELAKIRIALGEGN